MGPAIPLTDIGKRQLLWNLVTEFCQSFNNQIMGKYDPLKSRNNKKAKISIGAQI